MNAAVFRPIQFLGNKTRSLPMVTEAIVAGLGPGVGVWDAFSGSSVVAQAIASKGHRVVATDALACAATFARSVLGVQATSTDSGALLQVVLEQSRLAECIEPWSRHLAEEADAIEARDGRRLLELGASLEQRWRATTATHELKELFEASATAAGSRPMYAGLLSSVYAGTYFGLHQAIRLEAITAAIATLRRQHVFTPWESDVLLTAVCSAASEAVFSAGKHFAQPQNARAGKPTEFHAKRCLRDRSVAVDDLFADAVKRTVSIARATEERHEAHCRPVEDITADQIRQWGIRSVYADPPYTAQQYSRFYHVLDVIVTGIPPRLQRVKGRVTRGLYPDSKYHSPFCSRQQAPRAFEALAQIAKDAGARFVVSYSTTISGQTGNARTVSLKEIVSVLKQAFGPRCVQVEQLDFRYRQFNQGGAGRKGRDDPEFLIVGGAHAL